jgi:hypothetical protein
MRFTPTVWSIDLKIAVICLLSSPIYVEITSTDVNQQSYENGIDFKLSGFHV